MPKRFCPVCGTQAYVIHYYPSCPKCKHLLTREDDTREDEL